MVGLTQVQQDFKSSTSQFIRLLAPAGCGKTFSIIEKTKHLFLQNAKARISIFTFTRGAADEIRARCDNETCVSVNTLNSWGNAYIKSSVLRNAKIIATPKDRQFCFLNFLQPIWKQDTYANLYGRLLSGRSKVKHSEKLLEFMDAFKNIGFVHTDYSDDFAKNKVKYDNQLNFINRVGLGRYYDALTDELARELGLPGDLLKDKHEFIAKTWLPFWRDCCEQMLASGIYTMDDQKYFANLELQKKLEKHEKWTGASKIDYIFVDEFQDTSPLDIMLISNLQKLNDCALIIVGDDDQAIYEFRGATPYFILHPEEIFEQAFTTFILDQNFRSPSNIVSKSMQLISHNRNRVSKQVKSNSASKPAEITLITCPNNEQMIDAVINDIRNTLNSTDDNYTIAVLSRLKASLLPYQVLLTKDGIPYDVSEDLAFFLTGAAEDLNRVMTIKKKNNQVNREDLVELVCLSSKNEIYKPQRATLARLFLMNNVKTTNIRDALAAIAAKFQAFQNLFTDAFIEKFMSSMDMFLAAETVYDTLYCLLNNFDGLKQNYSRSLEDLYYRDPPLASLLDFASKYGSDYDCFLEDFNAAIEKATISKESADMRLFDETPRVVLSTALRVKGKQFNKVIILNVDDGIWPKTQAKTNEEAYEAERRLFYVATTRSRQSLRLYRSEIACGQNNIPSPFIAEGNYDIN